jgi:hypothetical protein
MNLLLKELIDTSNKSFYLADTDGVIYLLLPILFWVKFGLAPCLK